MKKAKTFPRVAVYRINEYAVNTLIAFRPAPKNMRAAIALSRRPGEGAAANPTCASLWKGEDRVGVRSKTFRGHMRGVTMGLN